MSVIQRKITLLLSTGFSLVYNHFPGRSWDIVGKAVDRWQAINRSELQKEIKKLYRSKLVDKKYNPDGSCVIFLTQKGKIKALNYKFSEMSIDSKVWDGKWRIVIFDIPEKNKRGRNSLRSKLQRLGFYEFQKSAFVLPYECRDEIEFLIEYFGLRKYVRYGLLESVDNDLHLRTIFGLDKK